jgi:hypothetical protein
VSETTGHPEYAAVSGEGDALKVLSAFPDEVKSSLGFELRFKRARILPIVDLCRESESGFGS